MVMQLTRQWPQPDLPSKVAWGLAPCGLCTVAPAWFTLQTHGQTRTRAGIGWHRLPSPQVFRQVAAVEEGGANMLIRRQEDKTSRSSSTTQRCTLNNNKSTTNPYLPTRSPSPRHLLDCLHLHLLDPFALPDSPSEPSLRATGILFWSFCHHSGPDILTSRLSSPLLKRLQSVPKSGVWGLVRAHPLLSESRIEHSSLSSGGACLTPLHHRNPKFEMRTLSAEI